VILLAEHDKPSLAAKKKRRYVALETATSTPKNRVWNFFGSPHGRTCSDTDLSAETATGSVQFSYETASGRGYYYTRDHLGSVREMLNSSGTILTRYSYDPYGRATSTYLSGSTDATFQFTDDYYHAASTLNLTLNRAYDANAGRWLSRDPLKDVEVTEGPNVYEYVGNNPIIFTDPSGLDTIVVNKRDGVLTNSPTGWSGFLNSFDHKAFGSDGPKLIFYHVCPPDHPVLVKAVTAGGGMVYDTARGGWSVSINAPADNDAIVWINTTTLWHYGWNDHTMDMLKHIILTAWCDCKKK
jgi:RHS repeat-associated protein